MVTPPKMRNNGLAITPKRVRIQYNIQIQKKNTIQNTKIQTQRTKCFNLILRFRHNNIANRAKASSQQAIAQIVNFFET
jgi:hypothetical protein